MRAQANFHIKSWNNKELLNLNFCCMLLSGERFFVFLHAVIKEFQITYAQI